MNVTLTLDDELVRKVRRIAAERDTTLTGLIRKHLEELADETTEERKRKERERLERSFAENTFHLGERNWTREELHERPGDKRRYPK